MDFLKLYYSSHQDGCSCAHDHDEHDDFDDDFEDSEIILVDPETNEEFSFIFYDNFIFEDEESFSSLVARTQYSSSSKIKLS